MPQPYLEANPPARRQFRPRTRKPTGLIEVHTAESAPDTVGTDDGALGVAAFIQRRADPGSYHVLADSDSWMQLVAYDQAAYGDGTGSNDFAIHVSAATQAARWPDLPAEWVEGCVDQMARAAADAAGWLERVHGITVPARRVTRAQSDQGFAGFISHGERDPGRRTDPGAAFPWGLFLDRFTTHLQGDPMADYAAQLNEIQATVEQIQRGQKTARANVLKRDRALKALVTDALTALRKDARTDRVVLDKLTAIETALAEPVPDDEG